MSTSTVIGSAIATVVLLVVLALVVAGGTWAVVHAWRWAL